MAPSSPSPSPNPSQEKNERKRSRKKKTVPKGEKLCVIDRQAFERELSSQRRALLFKCTIVHRKSTEDPRNFPKTSGVLTLIRNTGGKAWEYLAEAKSASPNIRMVQLETPELKKSLIFALRVSPFCSTPPYIGL